MSNILVPFIFVFIFKDDSITLHNSKSELATQGLWGKARQQKHREFSEMEEHLCSSDPEVP